MAAQSTRNLLKMKIHPADRGRRAKGSEKGLVPGWFSPQQWRELQPHVERLVSMPSRILLVAVTVEPTRQNFPDVAFGVFDAAERVALRRALEAARRKRAKSHSVDRSDLGSVSASKDSESLETNATAQISSPIRAIGGGGKESIRTCHSGSVARLLDLSKCPLSRNHSDINL